jgi:hypothetical protein
MAEVAYTPRIFLAKVILFAGPNIRGRRVDGGPAILLYREELAGKQIEGAIRE